MCAGTTNTELQLGLYMYIWEVFVLYQCPLPCLPVQIHLYLETYRPELFFFPIAEFHVNIWKFSNPNQIFNVILPNNDYG